MGISTGALLLGGLVAGGQMYQNRQQEKAANAAIEQQKKTAAEAEANKPQASKAPDAQGVAADMAGKGQAGGAPGVAQTFLTGASGIDPDTLKLGKSTLLGG